MLFHEVDIGDVVEVVKPKLTKTGKKFKKNYVGFIGRVVNKSPGSGSILIKSYKYFAWIDAAFVEKVI